MKRLHGWFLDTSIDVSSSVPAVLLRKFLWDARYRQRDRLLLEPMPDGWEKIVRDELRFVVNSIPDNELELFFNHMKVFGRSVRFVGVDGFTVQDTHRIVVAARAAQMSRNLSIHVWDSLSTIVLCPELVPCRYTPGGAAGVAIIPTVLLSWPQVEAGIRRSCDGRDVTIHELAHALDYGDLCWDGMPDFDRYLHAPDAARHFERALSEEYRLLYDQVAPSAFSGYPLTNRAEFFAKATELFFEGPQKLRSEHGRLHEALRLYFRCDPAATHR